MCQAEYNYVVSQQRFQSLKRIVNQQKLTCLIHIDKVPCIINRFLDDLVRGYHSCLHTC